MAIYQFKEQNMGNRKRSRTITLMGAEKQKILQSIIQNFEINEQNQALVYGVSMLIMNGHMEHHFENIISEIRKLRPNIISENFDDPEINLPGKPLSEQFSEILKEFKDYQKKCIRLEEIVKEKDININNLPPSSAEIENKMESKINNLASKISELNPKITSNVSFETNAKLSKLADRVLRLEESIEKIFLGVKKAIESNNKLAQAFDTTKDGLVEQLSHMENKNKEISKRLVELSRNQDSLVTKEMLENQKSSLQDEILSIKSESKVNKNIVTKKDFEKYQTEINERMSALSSNVDIIIDLQTNIVKKMMENENE
jgi:hypothetical protein